MVNQKQLHRAKRMIVAGIKAIILCKPDKALINVSQKKRRTQLIQRMFLFLIEANHILPKPCLGSIDFQKLKPLLRKVCERGFPSSRVNIKK